MGPRFRTLLVCILFSAGLTSCDSSGTLVVRWKVTTPSREDSNPCGVAGIHYVTISLSQDSGEPQRYTFACQDMKAELDLEPGHYSVEISEQTGGIVRQVATFQDVVVQSGTKRDLYGPYPPDPEDANDVELPWCGNGITEEPEVCDDGPQNSDTTPDACRTDCSPPRCGDGVADSDEECDDQDLKGLSCLDLNLPGGTLRCASNCELDESHCSAK